MRGLSGLRLITDNISVITKPFAKGSFFMKNGPVKLWFSDDFTSWILNHIPESVPAFSGTLIKTELTKNMYDSEIINELGNPKPFSIEKFIAIIRGLLTKQPNGEDGTLLTNSYCANIFYVQLENRVVDVFINRWFSNRRVWSLSAINLHQHRWYDSCCVFSRG